ncbi:hypothetical protein [Nostoc sp. NMS2]|uniref:hypothetical protein n=1 Tax=unclassified Nostoc TaxID=2593658 RepID=UPI00345581BA
MSSKKSLEIMLTEKHINIREATSKEDLLIAKYSYQMWLDIGVDEKNILHRVAEYYPQVYRRGASRFVLQGFFCRG